MAGANARSQPAVRFTAWLAATVALALVGYVGYVVYPRFDLPAGTGAGLLVLAVGAGVASFFSPCSFPLLVSMLARPIADDADERGPIARALLFATALAVGATGFLALAGILLALGGGALFDDVTFTSTTGRVIRFVVGTLLVAFGLIQTNRWRVNLRRIEPAIHGFLRRQAGLRRQRPVLGFALFGFGYLLAGFG